MSLTTDYYGNHSRGGSEETDSYAYLNDFPNYGKRIEKKKTAAYAAVRYHDGVGGQIARAFGGA